MTKFIMFKLDVSATFSDSTYSVQESTATLQVCIILEGLIERSISLQLYTLNLTALGK